MPAIITPQVPKRNFPMTSNDPGSYCSTMKSPILLSIYITPIVIAARRNVVVRTDVRAVSGKTYPIISAVPRHRSALCTAKMQYMNIMNMPVGRIMVMNLRLCVCFLFYYKPPYRKMSGLSIVGGGDVCGRKIKNSQTNVCSPGLSKGCLGERHMLLGNGTVDAPVELISRFGGYYAATGLRSRICAIRSLGPEIEMVRLDGSSRKLF